MFASIDMMVRCVSRSWRMAPVFAEATKVSKGFSTPKTVDLTPRRQGFDGQPKWLSRLRDE